MAQPVPAAIAFFALGALFLGSILLLLFNPRDRGVRWFVVFQTANMVWLGAQGWAFAAEAWPQVSWIVSATVHLLPALFIAYGMAQGGERPTRDLLLVIALGIVLLPIAFGVPGRPYSGLLNVAWQLAAWGVGTLLLLRFLMSQHRRKRPGTAAARRLGLGVNVMLLVVAPLVLVGVIVFGVQMFYYAMPLLVVWIQILVFVGVARLRFYNIEVRAARTGDLAAVTAEAERLAVVGEMTASLAHEIRNPLTGVRSLAQRLAEEVVDETRRRRYAGVILEEVGRVERLVSNLLDLAKRTSPTLQRDATTQLGPLFADLLLLLGTRAEKAGVKLLVDADDFTIPAPREVLAQALLNLLLNAIQHSPQGGSVHLLARQTADAFEILVRDRGPGVPPAERERIWEPFHSTSGGTGLGLTVVRRLAREQGWEVEAGAAPSGGAEFRLRIRPRVTGAIPAGRQALLEGGAV
jgi:signal transduction histidine kinase